jgi:hypothetical protein
VWIRIGRNHPRDIFVTLWERLEGGIADGSIRSPEEVVHELEQGDDDLAEQLKGAGGLFVPLAQPLQDAVREVMVRCSSLADPASDRNRADPFVVGLARLRGGIVVTEEKPRRADTAPMKIPDACGVFGLPYLNWFGFLRDRGWRL